MSKKEVLKVVLTGLKYIITLALGYLGGQSDVVSSIISKLIGYAYL